MEFRHLAITLSVICYAVTAYGQVLSGKDENSERTQSSQQQRHDLDENLLKKAVQQASGFGELDTRYGTALYDLAAFYSAHHNYTQAASLYEQVLTIAEKVHGPQDQDVATVLDELARIFREQARYSEAQDLLQRALTIRERILGPQHPRTATILHDLAGVYSSQGDRKSTRLNSSHRCISYAVF